jgi:CTP synthase
LQDASTTEFGDREPVVGMITEWMTAEGLQKREEGGDLGGTMRLGAYPAKLSGNSVVASSTATRRDQRAPSPPL